MNKLLNILLLSLTFIIVSCDTDKDNEEQIVLTNNVSTSQVIYADQTSDNEGGIRFKATEKWVATIDETTRAGGSNVDWLSLNMYDGVAGNYHLRTTISPNYSGKDRKAEIRISCGATIIKIEIEQKYTTVDGKELKVEIDYLFIDREEV